MTNQKGWEGGLLASRKVTGRIGLAILFVAGFLTFDPAKWCLLCGTVLMAISLLYYLVAQKDEA
jgi:hypothetical protein